MNPDAGTVQVRWAKSATTAFSELRPWLFTALVAAGFGYVAVVLCGRTNPMHSGNPGYWDFAFVVITAPVLYLVAATQTVRPFRAPWAHTVFRNGLCYALPFFLGLHWAFVGRILGASFSLTPQSLARMGPNDWFALLLGAAIVLGAVTWHLRAARHARILGRYVAAFLTLVGLFTAITIALRGSHYLHFHHYTWGVFFVPFWRFNHPVSAVLQGYFLGVYVEGIARWGRDPIWVPLG